MRKFLVHLLMLVMLMPGLTCGPFMAAGKAHASVSRMKAMPDCPGMTARAQDDGKAAGKNGLMMFKDCARVHLYGTNHAVLKKPYMGKVFFIAWADTVPRYVFTPADSNAIRGPPPDWPDFSGAKPSIILTTQRFRE